MFDSVSGLGTSTHTPQLPSISCTCSVVCVVCVHAHLCVIYILHPLCRAHQGPRHSVNRVDFMDSLSNYCVECIYIIIRRNSCTQGHYTTDRFAVYYQILHSWIQFTSLPHLLTLPPIPDLTLKSTLPPPSHTLTPSHVTRLTCSPPPRGPTTYLC